MPLGCSFITAIIKNCKHDYRRLVEASSFIHSGYFYSASSSPLLLRGAPGTARIPRRRFSPKHHRQLRVKDFPKDPTWRLERNSHLRTFGRMAPNLPMSHTIQRSGGSRGYPTMTSIQFGYRLWLPSNEEINVRYWYTY